MTKPSFSAALLPLFRLKFRVLCNTLTAKAGWKQILLGLSMAVAVFLAFYFTVSELLEEVINQRPDQAIWYAGFLLSFGIAIVFIGDLISGRTQHTGQMSSDFNYLLTLPIPGLTLMLWKIFERLTSDIFGAVLLLPCLAATACSSGVSAKALLLALVFYFKIAILLGTVINMVLLLLRHFFSATALNNFLALLRYLIALMFFLPFLFISMGELSIELFVELLARYPVLQTVLQPVHWLGTALMQLDNGQAFAYLCLLWLLSMLLLLPALHWLMTAGQTKSSGKKALKTWVWRPTYFKGMAQKDFCLLRRDLNLQTNALLLPVSVIIFNMFVFNLALEVESATALLNIIFAGIIYFCMFGPINAMGCEGRAVNLLEALPIHPQQLLKQKFRFWLGVALPVFLSVGIGTALYLEFSFATALYVLLQIVFFAAASIWAVIQLSAIYANYDARVLQQSSSFMAKITGVLLLLLLVPLKEFSLLNFFGLLLFVLFCLLLNMQARLQIYLRLEPGLSASRRQWTGHLLLLLLFVVVEVNIRQFFLAVIPAVDTGLWSWVLPTLLFAPMMLVSACKHRETGKSKTDSRRATWLSALVVGAVATAVAQLFINLQPDLKSTLIQEAAYYSAILATSSWTILRNQVLIAAIAACFAGSTAFLTAACAQNCQLAGKPLAALAVYLALPLLVPAPLVPAALLISILIAGWQHFFHRPSGAALIAAVATLGQVALLFN